MSNFDIGPGILEKLTGFKGNLMAFYILLCYVLIK
jgi:hypothetical protein